MLPARVHLCALLLLHGVGSSHASCDFTNGDCHCGAVDRCTCRHNNGHCFCDEAKECTCEFNNGDCFCPVSASSTCNCNNYNNGNCLTMNDAPLPVGVILGIVFGSIAFVILCGLCTSYMVLLQQRRQRDRLDQLRLMQAQLQVPDTLGQFQPNNNPTPGTGVPTITPVPVVAATPKGAASTSGAGGVATYPAAATSVQAVQAMPYATVTGVRPAPVQATSHPTVTAEAPVPMGTVIAAHPSSAQAVQSVLSAATQPTMYPAVTTAAEPVQAVYHGEPVQAVYPATQP